MHPRALTCRLCQQQFFPASLKFHLKVCAKRPEHVQLPCDRCGERFPCTMLTVHMKLCEQPKRRVRTTGNRGLQRPHSAENRRQGGVGRRGRDTPSSTANSGADQQQYSVGTPQAAREHAQEPPLQAQSHGATNSAPRGLGANYNSISTSERLGYGNGNNVSGNKDCVVGAPASDGRIACANCQRWFSADRVGAHQDICARVNPPSVRDPGGRGNVKTAGSKKTKLAPSRVDCRQWPSSRPVVGKIYATARPRVARGRSVGGERGTTTGRRAIDNAGDMLYFGSDDRTWREPATNQAGTDTKSPPRASAPESPLSAGAEYRGESVSGSLGLEETWPIQAEKQRHQQRQVHRHRPRGTPRRRESWDDHRRDRRPSSATGLRSSSSGEMPPLIPSAEWSRKRVPVGRAVSMSCSPVRDRKTIHTTAAEAQSAGRDEECARRSSAVGAWGGRLGRGGGGAVDSFGRRSDTSGRVAAERGVGNESLSGGMGFFSPARDGGRIRLLK